MKYIHAIAVVLIVILMAGCTEKLNKNPPSPENLIPKDKMIELLTDIHLAEAAIFSKQKLGENIDIVKYDFYFFILEKYQISPEQFKQSFRYYQADLEVFDEIYMEVITLLSKKKDQLKSDTK